MCFSNAACKVAFDWMFLRTPLGLPQKLNIYICLVLPNMTYVIAGLYIPGLVCTLAEPLAYSSSRRKLGLFILKLHILCDSVVQSYGSQF